MNILNEDMIKFKMIETLNSSKSIYCVGYYSGIHNLQKRMYNLYKCKTPYTVFYKDELVIDSNSNDDLTFEEERELILNRVKLINSVKKMEGE